ncbi:MAG: MBL fold metallo-hydrolase [Patescibacteria group bacterium]
MKITKLGHCCLLIEENGLRLLTDPGSYTTEPQEELKNIDVILITHEHQDHLHIDSLKIVLNNNPEAIIITNTAVAKLLDEAGIGYELVKNGEKSNSSGVVLEAFEQPHAEIYKTWPRVLNTGFFIANKLFYPGDALIDPKKPIEVLALPVAGPWIKISEAIDYALALKPKHAFPVHDGGLKSPGIAYRVPSEVLPKDGINFAVIADGETNEY